MNTGDIRPKVLALLTQIAPDIEPSSIVPAREFRDQFDFDSMDALHFAAALSETFGIEIPERDYPKLAGLDAAVQFVQERLANRA